MRVLAPALVLVVVAGCGQTSHDNGGTGGAGGSSGTGSAPAFDCVGEHWKRLAPQPGSTPRGFHGAVAWRDDEILVWGGGEGQSLWLGTGWRVRADGTVASLPTAGAPSPRSAHAIDVLGDRLLVWGGYETTAGYLGDGASLDLLANKWSPLPAAKGLLTPRRSPAFGVVGNRWLVWGGLSDGAPKADGAIWDPKTNAWTLAPQAPVATWMSDMASLAQGGSDVGPVVLGETKDDTGYAYGYDPDSDQWWTMAPGGAPSPRSSTSLTWSPTTKELIVWGGFVKSQMATDGARYSLAGTWTPMSTQNAPGPRAGHHAVMLGTKLVVFGGSSGLELETATGGIYDVTTDTWSPLPLGDCAPPPRSSATFTAFGNGTQALLWGGVSPDGQLEGEYGWLLTL